MGRLNMEDLKARWTNLNSGAKVIVGAVGAVVGVIFVLKLLPALVAVFGLGAMLLIFIVPYWIPTIIAFRRQHISKAAIAVLNFFLGWTLIGWIIALIWSLSRATYSQIEVQSVVVQNNFSANTPPPPVYQVGDVVNGHRFNGTSWLPIVPGESTD